MSRERPTTADAMREILACVASNLDTDVLASVESTVAGQLAHRANIEDARSLRRGYVPESAERATISVDEFRPAGARERVGELLELKDMRRRTRMPKSQRAHLDRFIAEQKRRGHPDPHVLPIRRKQRLSGALAMQSIRAAVRALPPFIQLAVVKAYTTPAREVHAAALAAGIKLEPPSPSLTEQDWDRPVWDHRNRSHCKHVGIIGAIIGGAEPTTRPGYSHVCAGYAVGALARCVPNAYPDRPNRIHATEGDSTKFYGTEMMSCVDTDRFGFPRGGVPTLRVWRAVFDLPIEIHQPDGGAPGIGRYERGIDGRWIINQYWIASRWQQKTWSKRARRNVMAPEVLAWLGMAVTDADVREWRSWLGELDRRERAAPDVAEQLEHIARDYAEHEARAIDAHNRRDLPTARDAAAAAQRLRMLGSSIEPAAAWQAREEALRRRGIWEASHALAADLSRRRRRGRRPSLATD